MTLREILIEALPFRAEFASLEYVETDTYSQAVIVRLVCWERFIDSSFMSILDVREESILIPSYYDNEERNRAFVEALKKVCTKIFSNAVKHTNYDRFYGNHKEVMRPDQRILSSMAGDFLSFTALRKRTFNTVGDFEKALLTKGRLGHLL